MIHILGTKSNKIGSKLIRWNTGEDISHVVIQLSQNHIMHSNYKGVHIQTLEKFLAEGNEIISKVAVTDPTLIRKFILNIEIFKDKKFCYDYFALWYLGMKYLFNLVGIKFPKQNLWQVTGMYMCTEFVTYLLHGKENSTITPGQLIDKLKQEQK